MMSIKKVITILIVCMILFLASSCSKDQKFADKYSGLVAEKVKQVKAEKKYFQPTSKIVISFLQENEDKLPIESFEIKEIGGGIISISVNGKVGTAIYQTPQEYNLEKESLKKDLQAGPVIKKFYLGMSKDATMGIIKETFPPDNESKYKFGEFIPEEKQDKEMFEYVYRNFLNRGIKNWIYYNSGQEGYRVNGLMLIISSEGMDLISQYAGGHSFFLFDNDDQLVGFQLGKEDVKHLFNTGDMSSKLFTQNFLDYYSFIDNMKPLYKQIDGRLSYWVGSVSGIKKGYEYESEYGWSLEIFFTDYMSLSELRTDNRIYDSNESEAVAIRLIKKKSAAEIKFGD